MYSLIHYLELFAAIIFIFTATVQAHMSLWYPPPLGGSREANPLTTNVDTEFNFPYGCCDSEGGPNLPSLGDCRGHLDLLGTDEGRPQVIWTRGQDAYFQLSTYTYTPNAPGSTHSGGSCQVGFSVDQGRNWKVAASYPGGCPRRNEDDDQKFGFKVPENMPVGEAVFAWIWLNREHEFFMNCAAVLIESGFDHDIPSQSKQRTSPTAFPILQTVEATRIASCQNDHNLFGSTSIKRSDTTATKPTENRYRDVSSQVKPCEQRPDMIPGSWVGSLETRDRREACDWDLAPIMETSYYTIDAQCAPDAKAKNPQSDSFEVRWADNCVVYHGENQYPLETLSCS